MARHAWDGDWHARIEGYVRRYGYSSLTAFAESMPAATMLELAEVLGPHVAAIQLETILREEAEQAGQLDRFMRSLLVRNIREWIPAGWSQGEDFISALSGAFAGWGSALDDITEDADQHRLWNWFRHNADIPDGWLPAGPDDPIIERAFRETGFGRRAP